jgi:tetratricopeptide (TPR) repeat protein
MERWPGEALLIRAVHDRSRLGRGESSLALFEELARTYPDDAEAWLELGDTYFHAGPDMLIPPSRAAAAFDRAIALDSTFWPPYGHRIDHAGAAHVYGRRDATASSVPERSSGHGAVVEVI